MLEPDRIRSEGGDVNRDEDEEAGSERERSEQRDDAECHRRLGGHADREAAGSDRPELLPRMLCVERPIADVVEQVDGGTRTTKARKSSDGVPENVLLEEPARSSGRGKDEQVLHPLPGPQAHEQRLAPPRG